ncbi:MAG: choice-of-anchor Q domain-containing protein [Bacteroidales bacterium]
MRKLLLTLTLLAATTQVFSQISFVTPWGSGTMDGSSWSNALDGNTATPSGYTRLAASLMTGSAGTQYWIAEGVYFPSTDNDRTKSFSINPGVSIYGGFSGNEDSLSQRNWELHQSVFSGDIGTLGINTDNAYHVFTFMGGTSSTPVLFDGITIRDGYARNPVNPNNYPLNYGGGILNTTKLNIQNCFFTANHAAETGGAIHNNSGTLNVINSKYIFNTAFSGAGIGVSNGTVTIERSKFSQNTANYNGGAIQTGGTTRINNCLVVNNHGYNGGGILITENNTIINNSTIANNQATLGNICVWVNSSGQIRNSIVSGNNITVFSNASISCSYSCIDGSITGEGVINANPLFNAPTLVNGSSVDGLAADWRLRWCSPCFESGNSALNPAGMTTDISGQSRILYSQVDMGAFELDTTGLFQNRVGFEHDIIVVSDSNAYYGDGADWEHAVAGNAESCRYPGQTLLYEAMKDALPGTEIWVQKGTYLTSLYGNQNHSFTVSSGVKVYGGFEGSEINRANRGNELTYFSGELGNSALTSDNAYHVFHMNQASVVYSDTAVLDQVAILKGSASSTGLAAQAGGILVNGGTKIRLSHCNIYGNNAKGNGGAVLIQPNAYVWMEYDSIVRNNLITYTQSGHIYSYNGSGIYNQGKLYIDESVISNNLDGTEGTGIFNTDTLIMNNCILDSNRTTVYNSSGGCLINTGFCEINGAVFSHSNASIRAGSIWNKANAFLKLTNCSISHNNSTNSNAYGGGIYNDGDLNLIDCQVNHNTTKDAGGGLYNSPSANCDITGSVFSWNIAEGAFISSGGGGIFNHGTLFIEKSEICNNRTTGFGGGIYGPSQVKSCLIANNTKGGTFKTGGGLRVTTGCLGIINSTIVNNTGQGVASTTVSGQTVQEIPDPDTFNIKNCIIYGNDAQVSGHFIVENSCIEGGNLINSCIFDDPVFESPSGGKGSTFDGLLANWNLADCSPCINKGNNSFLGTADSLDVDKNSRITFNKVDMGAFELQTAPLNRISFTQAVIYIGDSTTYTHNGSSWSEMLAGNAPSCRYPGYTMLYEALRDLPDSCEIRMKNGTYYPTWTTDRGKSLFLKPGIKMSGGYSGSWSLPDERDMEVFPTMISGDIGIPGDSTDNSYHLCVTLPQENPVTDSVIIDGLNFTGAVANASGDQSMGGCFQIDPSARLYLDHCIFTGNYGFYGGVANNKGYLRMSHCDITNNKSFGIIYNRTGSSFIADHVNWEQNRHTDYGYILSLCASVINEGNMHLNNSRVCNNHGSTFESGGISNKGTAWMKNCVFTGNNSGKMASAINNSDTLYMEDCRIDSNYSVGGAMNNGGYASLLNCSMEFNKAGSGDGGIIQFGAPGALVNNGTLIAKNTAWRNNAAMGRGGAISNVGTFIADSVTFDQNVCGKVQPTGSGWFVIYVVSAGFTGGGLYNGGGQSLIQNSTFYNNKATYGGAVSNLGGSTTLTACKLVDNFSQRDGCAILNTHDIKISNCLIANNISLGLNARCGTVSVGKGSKTEITGSTIAHNSGCNYLVTGVDIEDINGYDTALTKDTVNISNSILWENQGHINSPNNAELSFRYCCTEDTLPGIGNIFEDPWFIRPTTCRDTTCHTRDANWQLYGCSPCINTGSDTLSADTTDLAGNPRIVETTDIGAFEYQEIPTGHRVSGYLTYDNNNQTAVDSTTAYLWSGNQLLDSCLVRSNGFYCFSNILPGNYHITFGAWKHWGGVNATDALLIMNHFASLTTLSGLHLQAADTDPNGYINSVDALQSFRRFVALINSFGPSDWVFQESQFTMADADISLDIKALCRGDVNGTYQ